MDINQYGYSYVIKDQSTQNKLTATYYYQLRNQNSDTLDVTISQWAIISPDEVDQIFEGLIEQAKREVTQEEAIEMLKDEI